MQRILIAAAFCLVFGVPAKAEDKVFDQSSFLIGGGKDSRDRDAYEEDYTDEFEKATKGEYEAKHGEKKERLQEHEWEIWRRIEDTDWMWIGPIQHENGNFLNRLQMGFPLEAAGTLDKWRFLARIRFEIYDESYDDTQAHSGASDGGEDIHTRSYLGLGVFEIIAGLPWRFELGLRYIGGADNKKGDNDTFWYQGRDPIIRDDHRDPGSKCLIANLKWNLLKHKDGVTGVAINIRYKEPLAIRASLLDSQGRDVGAQLALSLKWGPAAFHGNFGYINVGQSRTLFFHDRHSERIRDIFTTGFTATLQIWKYVMLIGQIEAHTNAYRSALPNTYNARWIGTIMAGLRVRIGPLVLEGGLGRRLNQEAALYDGQVSIGIKF